MEIDIKCGQCGGVLDTYMLGLNIYVKQNHQCVVSDMPVAISKRGPDGIPGPPELHCGTCNSVLRVKDNKIMPCRECLKEMMILKDPLDPDKPSIAQVELLCGVPIERIFEMIDEREACHGHT